MYSLLGSNSSIKALRPLQVNANGNFANLMFNNVVVGNLLTPARFAFNGMFYVIDTVLVPPSFPFVSLSLIFVQVLNSSYLKQ